MQTKTGVIFLQKTKFQLYSPFLSNVLEFNFIPELVRDYDLVNKELFENLLKAFFTNNKIPAGSFIIMIADNASFIKDFTSTASTTPPVPTQPGAPAPIAPLPTAANLEDLQGQANEFLEHVPFDIVASKTYPLPNGVRAYATNQEIFDAIKNLLEKQGFLITVVIPSFAFGPEMSALTALNINAINTIFQKVNLVKEYNLLNNPKSPIEDLMAATTEEKDEQSGVEIDLRDGEKKPTKPIFLILLITGIIVIVLGTIGVLFWQFASVSPPKPTPSSPKVQSFAATPTPVEIPASESQTVEPKNLTVQIVNSTAASSASATIQTDLAAFGFKEVTTKVQPGLQAQQALIIFSPNVTTELKGSVTAAVRKTLPNILGQDKTDAAVDIQIITGK